MDHKKVISETSSNLLAGQRTVTKHENPVVYPNVEAIIEVIRKLRMALFPGYFQNISEALQPDIWLQALLAEISQSLKAEMKTALSEQKSDEEAAHLADKKIAVLFENLKDIQQLLHKDAEAGFAGDPAAHSADEVILTYPGFFAVLVHRIAHVLFQENVPYIPRIMSEHAHTVTGIDIHPGATIGEYFFIDHGTGVVIGETTLIGSHVKLYQGVTLGGLSTKGGQKLAGKRRHPTIEDHVTIYSGATILGGETVIGKNSTIGGNMFITKSVPRDTTVS
jgi:serine O-acetyltransferase